MQDLENWLRFVHVDMSARRSRILLHHFGTPKAILEASVEEIGSIVGKRNSPVDRIHKVREMDISSDLQKMQKLDISLETVLDPDYPPNLKEIPDPPNTLFIRGNLLESDRFAIAIVGTRRPSAYGEEIASVFARDLAQRGLTIVSGMAYGIDTCAHRAALAAGGRTIAVLGCGVDNCYPQSNRKLMEEISQNGAVISEYALGTQPEGWRFPARNRIISGLSLGIVVVDAPSDSGALITADFALEQGREVFAVPGPIHLESSRGAHRLLKEGATLVESADDVLAVLGIETTENPVVVEPSTIPKDLDPNSSKILKILSLEPIQGDELIRETGLTASEVGTSLMMLEIRGIIRRLPGGRFVRTSFRD